MVARRQRLAMSCIQLFVIACVSAIVWLGGLTSHVVALQSSPPIIVSPQIGIRSTYQSSNKVVMTSDNDWNYIATTTYDVTTSQSICSSTVVGANNIQTIAIAKCAIAGNSLFGLRADSRTVTTKSSASTIQNAVYGIDIDPTSGSMFVAGTFNSIYMNFGSPQMPLIRSTLWAGTTSYKNAAFMISLNSGASTLPVKHWYTVSALGGTIIATAVAVDRSNGTVYTVGSYDGTGVLRVETSTHLPNALATCPAGGTPIGTWLLRSSVNATNTTSVKLWCTPGVTEDRMVSIAVDLAGAVFIAGYSSSAAIVWGSGVVTSNPGPAGTYQPVILKLAWNAGAQAMQAVYDISMQGSGLYVAHAYNTNIRFDPLSNSLLVTMYSTGTSLFKWRGTTIVMRQDASPKTCSLGFGASNFWASHVYKFSNSKPTQAPTLPTWINVNCDDRGRALHVDVDSVTGAVYVLSLYQPLQAQALGAFMYNAVVSQASVPGAEYEDSTACCGYYASSGQALFVMRLDGTTGRMDWSYPIRDNSNAASANGIKVTQSGLVQLYLSWSSQPLVGPTSPLTFSFSPGSSFLNGIVTLNDKCTHPNYCVNGGNCTNLNTAGIACRCRPGYAGTACQTDINECASLPCMNGGTCADNINGFRCACVSGWSGARCQTDINECASTPCQNGGTCTDLVNGFTCACPGFSGVLCQTDLDECASQPCLNGGLCLDGSNRFTCQCQPGFSGRICETEINECASSPCQYGATCVDEVNGFHCLCKAGYSGVLCASDLDECASNPCQNSGTCVDAANGFTCNCPITWTGLICTIDVNECATNNGGCGPFVDTRSVCVNLVGSYYCAPYIYQFSVVSMTPLLSFVPGNSTARRTLTLLNTRPGTAIQFRLSSGTLDPTQFDVRFGASTAPASELLTCDGFTLLPPFNPSNQLVTCNITAGYGRSNQLTIWTSNVTRVGAVGASIVGGKALVSLPSNDTLAFPPPTLTSQSLRSNVSHLTSILGLLSFPSTAIYVIQMDGTNLFPPTYNTSAGVLNTATRVTYGGGSSPYECKIDTTYSSFSTVSCATAQFSQGQFLPLTVSVGGQIVVSTDVINYPVAPVVFGANGCDDHGNTTANCPTEGGIQLTVKGINFFNPLSIYVGGVSCSSAFAPSTGIAYCTLPASTGEVCGIVVSTPGEASEPINLLSYSLPTITGVEGCTPQDALTIQYCDRQSVSLITVRGLNFGPIAPTILVGGGICTDVTLIPPFPQRTLTCLAPPNKGLVQPILILQHGGGIGPLPATGAVSYRQCAAGTYAVGLSCLPCPAGAYSSSLESLFCASCVAGTATFMPDGASQCLPCLQGTISIAGQTICSNCTAGRYAGGTGSVLCDLCIPGGFSPSNGSVSCLSCGVGSYQPSFGASACVACEPGQYTDALQQVSCQACASGSFAPFPGSTACTACAVGSSQLSQGHSACNNCTAGYYIDVTGQSACVPCPAGTSSNRNGTVTCPACARGRYSTVVGLRDCLPCPIGTYADQPNNVVCKDCPAGLFSNVTGESSCLGCSIGYYQPASGQSVCVKCGYGNYQDTHSQSACKPCGSGRYSARNASAGCDDCTYGKYLDQFGGSVCLECAPGQFTNSLAAPICQSCPPGLFNPFEGGQQCFACFPGSVSIDTGASVCANCSYGRFNFAYQQSECALCFPGTHSNQNGSLECTPCEIGKSQQLFGQAECEFCELGKYNSDVNAPNCALCPLGRFANETGQLECSPCAIGGVAGSSGQTACSECSAGKYQDTSSQLACKLCAAGSFAPTNGSTACLECAIGEYNDDFGQSTCKLCETGKYGLASAQIGCAPCAPGKFAGKAGSDHCDACPAGSISAVQGQSVCLNCTIGKYSSVDGQALCVRCLPGSATAVNGSISCQLCRPGFFAAGAESAVCLPCPAGTYTDDFATNLCKSCPVGSYTGLPAQIRCDSCEAGKHQPLAGQSTCVECAVGSAQPIAGLAACKYCSPGSYSNRIGLSNCDPCPSGTFQSKSNATACEPCPLGRYQQIPGAVVCSPCGGGSYSDYRGGTACTACGAGLQQQSEGQTQCVECEVGRFSLGSTASCRDCGGGTMQPATGKSECVTCPPHSTSNLERTICNCGVGYYSTRSSAPTGDLQRDREAIRDMECIACSKGIVCDSEGLLRNELVAAAGYWHASNESLNFVQCLQSTNCVGGSCAPHRVGPLCAVCEIGYQASAQSDECTICPSQSASLGGSIGFTILLISALLVIFAVIWNSDGRRVPPKVSTFTRVQAWTPEDRLRPDFTYNMKLILSYLQIATSLLSFVNVPWPTYFSEFISKFSFVNLQFIPWGSVNCVATLSFYEKLVLIAIIPPVVLFILGSLPLLLLYILQPRVRAEQSSQSEHITRHYYRLKQRKVIKLVVFALFLVYPNVSSSVLAYFQCREVDGVSYLIADFRLVCYNAEWHRYLGLGVFLLIVYPIGIPLAMFSVLWYYRMRLHRPDVRIAFGIVYDAYQRAMWWFEMADMAVKLFLTSVLGFFDAEGVCIAGMLATGIYECVLLVWSPYVRKLDDRLACLSYAQLFLIVCIGLTLQQSTFVAGSTTDVFASVLMLLVMVVLMLLIIFHVFVYVRKTVRTFQRAKLEKATDIEANVVSNPLHRSTHTDSGSGSGGRNGSGTIVDDDLNVHSNDGGAGLNGGRRASTRPERLSRVDSESGPSRDSGSGSGRANSVHDLLDAIELDDLQSPRANGGVTDITDAEAAAAAEAEADAALAAEDEYLSGNFRIVQPVSVSRGADATFRRVGGGGGGGTTKRSNGASRASIMINAKNLSMNMDRRMLSNLFSGLYIPPTASAGTSVSGDDADSTPVPGPPPILMSISTPPPPPALADVSFAGGEAVSDLPPPPSTVATAAGMIEADLPPPPAHEHAPDEAPPPAPTQPVGLLPTAVTSTATRLAAPAASIASSDGSDDDVAPPPPAGAASDGGDGSDDEVAPPPPPIPQQTSSDATANAKPAKPAAVPAATVTATAGTNSSAKSAFEAAKAVAAMNAARAALKPTALPALPSVPRKATNNSAVLPQVPPPVPQRASSISSAASPVVPSAAVAAAVVKSAAPARAATTFSTKLQLPAIPPLRSLPPVPPKPKKP